MFRTIAAAGLVLMAFSPAGAGSLEDIERECHAQLGLGDAGCRCIRDRAEAELNETQQRFLLAKVRRDQAAERAMSLPIADSQEVVAFIQSAPRTCVSQ
jgi:hypothetical protein